MTSNLTYSTNILDTLGVLSSFRVAESIWSKYEKYAIPKIEEATLKIRGSLFYVKDLTPKQAQNELKSIDPIISTLWEFRKMLEPIDDQKYQLFKNTAIEFFETIDLLHDNLQDVAQMHSSYEMSMPVLAKDWDSTEDEHWDKY